MRDTRHLFDSLSVRKPSTWDEVPHAELGTELLQAAMRLPRRVVAWEASPMSDIFRGDSRRTGAIEWVVERLGEEDIQYFYVNTEGYTYARYAFRFTPRPV
jgi:hypothetical protein